MFVVNSKSTITSSTFSLDIRYVVMSVTQVRMFGEFTSVNVEAEECTIVLQRTKTAFPPTHLLSGILTAWESKQQAKGASRALMGMYNPFTYTTMQLFFVLICNVIYLYLRYLSVLCCVNCRLCTVLAIPCCPSVTVLYVWLTCFVLHHCVAVWILLQGRHQPSIKPGTGCHLSHSPPGSSRRYFLNCLFHHLCSFTSSLCVFLPPVETQLAALLDFICLLCCSISLISFNPDLCSTESKKMLLFVMCFLSLQQASAACVLVSFGIFQSLPQTDTKALLMIRNLNKV